MTAQEQQPHNERENWMRPDQSRLLQWLVAALMVTTTFVTPWSVQAQDATPAARGEPLRSLTRDEFIAEFEEDLGFSEGTPGGTFIDAYASDVQTIHPLLAEDEVSWAVVSLVYEGLIGIDPRTGQPAPTGLADSWEIAPDGRTYTFHLSKDATWDDGTDVTAEDVQFSFDALANPDVGSAYTQSFLDAAESWRAIDDDTFEVVSREPLYTFLYNLVTWIIPTHIWEDVPVADWRTDGGATGQDPTRVVGSGPFTFREWRQSESVTLDRNDDYHGHVPYLDAYTLLLWPDQTAVVNALLNGEIDAAVLEPSDVETVNAIDDLLVATYPTEGFTFYLTNLDPEKSTLFLDRRVRQALLFGLDREAIVNDILLGNAEVAHGTQPVISYAHAPDRMTTRYDYDPEKARTLLTEAGWTDSDGDGILDKDGVRFAFEIIYQSGSPTYDQELAYMQDAWRAIGIDATPRALEFPALIETLTVDHDFDIALLGFNWDASFLQDSMFGCDQYEGGFNVMRYCNEAVDALNAEAMRTFNDEARRELVIEATDLINEDLPVAVLHFDKTNIGYSARLRNYVPSTWGTDFTYVWVQE
jgi:peptide/nickel transport system substrate-binding protein